jgi:hypothetical protein
MPAADAQSVLVDKIRAAQETISPGSTSCTDMWTVAPPEEPSRPPKDPLASVVILFREIEGLLSPKGGGFWKLQLGQRRRGERKVPSVISDDICRQYEGELALEDHPRPKKVIIGDIAKEYGLTDAAVREIIRRERGKKTKRKATK